MSAAEAVSAISRIIERMVAAWNKGSAADFAAPFTGSADFIAFEGTHLRGRQQIEAFHRPLFEGVLKGSLLQGEVRFIRLLTPDLAVMHATARVTLPGRSEPSPSRDSMQLFVVVHVAGEWRAEAMLNARKITLEQQGFADRLSALSPEARLRVEDLAAALSTDSLIARG
jgi:uncharacterized protein (TIGR02246 family)